MNKVQYRKTLRTIRTLSLAFSFLFVFMIGCSTESSKEVSSTLLNKPKALLAEKKYEDAYQEFNRLATGDELKNYPDIHAEATFRAAYSLQMLDRFGEALDSYNNFLTQFPDSRWVENTLYLKGVLNFYGLSNYEACRDVLKELQGRYPESTLKDTAQRLIKESFLEEAQVLLTEEKYKEASQEFNRLATGDVLKDYPDLQAKARSKATYSFLKQVGKDDEMLIPYIDFLTESSETKFVEDNALFNIGVLSFKLKSYEASLGAFEQLRENLSDSDLKASALYNIGMANFNLRNYEDCRYALTEFLSEFPNSSLREKALYNRGEANYKLQNYEESRDDFGELLDSFPKSEFKNDAERFIATSALEEVKLLLEAKKYELAYQEFDKLIASGKFENYSDLQAEAMYRGAYSLKQFGLERRNKAVNAAVLNHNDQAQAYNNQVILHNAEALNRYAEFIDHFPESQYVVTAYIDSGNIYLHQDEYSNARAKYEKAIKRTDDLALQAQIQFFIGLTYYEQGDSENAISADTSLLHLYPESDYIVKTKFRIADSHFRLQQWEDAISAYSRVISEHKEAKEHIPRCSYQIAEAYYKLATDESEKILTSETLSELSKLLEPLGDGSEDQNSQLGQENQSQTEFESAAYWYQKILEDFPTDEVAPYALHGMMQVLNDLERKDELERLVLEHGISSSMPISNTLFDIDLTGLFYFKLALNQEEHLKDYKEALESYQKAIPRLENPLIRVQSYYRRGVIYQDKLDPSDKDKALEVFQTLISEYGNSENQSVVYMVADARIRLSELNKQLEPSSGTVTEGKTHRQIEKKAFSSTVLLEVVDAKNRRVGIGSGFFVRPGLVATNFHVVKNVTKDSARRVYVRLLGQEKKHLIKGYTAVDIERDLIVLKVENITALPLSLGDSKVVHSGDPVYAMGNPGLRWRGEVIPLEGTFTAGIISALPHMRGNRWIQFDASISGGNSGGPLLNSKSEVVGVVTAKYGEVDDANLATPSEYLSSLLNKMGAPKPLWQAALAK